MIRALALSPDKKLLASGGADHAIIIWDLGSGKQLATLTGHPTWVLALAFSPDKKYLAGGSYDGTVRIWNLINKRVEFEIKELQPHNITSLAFSPKSEMLVIASADNEIKIWDMREGKMRPPLKGHSFYVTQVTFLSDGKTLVSSSYDKTMRFWNLAKMEVMHSVALPQAVTSFAFSHDEKLVAVTTIEEKISVFEFEGSRIKKPLVTIPPRSVPKTLEGIQYRNWRLGFSLTGLYAAGSLYFLSDHELAFVDGMHLKVWDVRAGTEKLAREIESPTGSYAVTGRREDGLLIYGDGAAIKILDIGSRKERELQGSFSGFHTVDFSLDGRTLIALFGEDGVGKWGKKKQSFTLEEGIAALRRINNPFATYLFSERLGIEIRPYDPAQPDIYLLKDNEVTAVLKGHRAPVTAIAVNLDETMLASNSQDGTFLLWDLKARKVIKPLEASGNLIRFSPDGRFLAVWGEDKTIRLFDLKNLEKEPVAIKANVDGVMFFSPDSEVLAAIDIEEDNSQTDPSSLWFIERYMRARNVLTLWRVQDGKPVNYFSLFTPWGGIEIFDAPGIMGSKTNTEPFGSAVFNEARRYKTVAGPVAFWKDHTLMAASLIDHVTENYQIKIWNPVTYEEVHSLAGHAASIRSLAFSPDGKFLASASFDGTLKLWNLDKDTEAATLIALDASNWIVYTPEGRFDTNIDVYEMDKLSWTWPADPLNPLSLRVFMRDYYEPNLLLKILTGQPLRPVRNLASLNRAQPTVKIKEVKPDGADAVQVLVEVANAVGDSVGSGKGRLASSGIFDVRLLRDGKLVASSTAYESLVGYAAKVAWTEDKETFDERGMELWRQAHEVKLDASGKALLVFRNIKLPLSDGAQKVAFSAYAFNSDRVTGETASYIYERPLAPAKTKRRAYIITVGVDANQSGWNLDFAAKSADDMRRLLRDRRYATRGYDVVDIQLLSTFKADDFRHELKTATKENIHAVLELLAGKTVDQTRRAEVDPENRLQAARPDDLVLLFIASHGYADPQGNFYVIPYDTGKPAGVSEQVLNSCFSKPDQSQRCVSAKAFLDQSISSNDLASWWRDVDAGEMVMILDSCHSAAVPGREFRPGPLGDPGFGQLAYDKGMLILTATQPDKPALATLQSGERSLLSDALIDSSTGGGQSMAEWLAEAERLVPEKYEVLYPEVKKDDVQLPVLLDFTKRSFVKATR